jgi:hypothetical protein
MHRPIDSRLDESVFQSLLLSNGVQTNRTSEIQRDYAKLDESVFQKLLVGNEVQIQGEAVIQGIEDPGVRDIVQNILGQLLRLFDWLGRIEDNLHKLDTLLESLSLLEVVHLEARSLVEFIKTNAMRADSISEKLNEVLDGINYGITHDLKRIFERELVGKITEQPTPIVYGKILHAHGLLTNCFQQSSITLLQIFNPSLDGASLFNDYEQRLKQSLMLCRDLSSLMRLVRRAEGEADPDTLRKVVEQILEFRDGNMQYLMYKDWKGYENLAVAVITSIEGNFDAHSLLHRFLCYLELMYSHVKMRAVLKDLFPSSAATDDD